MTHSELTESERHVLSITANFDKNVPIVFKDFGDSIFKLFLVLSL